MAKPIVVPEVPNKPEKRQYDELDYLLDGRIYLHPWDEKLTPEHKITDRFRARVSAWATSRDGRVSCNKRPAGMYVQFFPNAPN